MQRTVAGSCERGNKYSGSIKDGEFLEQLRDFHFLKKVKQQWAGLVVG
jgi:hypothetical protein